MCRSDKGERMNIKSIEENFKEWWEELVSDGEWTTLERLAAKEAWDYQDHKYKQIKINYQEAIKQKKEECALICEGIEYHSQGMGCGLEDLNITDRYEAMEYGWNQCLEDCVEQIRTKE